MNDIFIFFFSASGVAGLAGAIASNPIDVVRVSWPKDKEPFAIWIFLRNLSWTLWVCNIVSLICLDKNDESKKSESKHWKCSCHLHKCCPLFAYCE